MRYYLPRYYGYNQKDIKTSVDGDVEKLEYLNIAGQNVKQYRHFGKQSVAPQKKFHRRSSSSIP
jgi:hypothetical protein